MTERGWFERTALPEGKSCCEAEGQGMCVSGFMASSLVRNVLSRGRTGSGRAASKTERGSTWRYKGCA